MPTFPWSRIHPTVTDAASSPLARRERPKVREKARRRSRSTSIAMRVEPDGERWATDETDGEPGAAADAVEDARGASRAMWTCAYADSRGCAECFTLTLPCAGAARRGCVECLRYARERTGAGWDARATRAAAREGQLECLKYLHENECPWDAGACGEAARRGHLECLKYLHENGCPWDEWAYRPVAQGGHPGCLRYLRENGCPRGERMVDSTASPIQRERNTNVHGEAFSRAGQRQRRREQVVVDDDQNHRLATAGRVFKHKNVAAVKAADTKRYDRGSVKSVRRVTHWPLLQEYKGGHVARVTREDNKDISNVHQPRRQRMKELCAMYNCEEVPTRGDGNCQFRALSVGIYEREDRHAEVRANIVQHLRENSERYFQFVESGEVFADYVNRISQDGQWGDEITLRAFVEYYSRGVRVLSDNEQNSVIDHIREGLQGDAITITHYGEVHYNGTKPIHA